jgi:bacterial leucyl aminopeptidase
MDVTDQPNLGSLNAERLHASSIIQGSLLSSEITPKEFVKTMLSDIEDTYLRKDIANLTSFWTRWYRSSWGLKSSNWLYDTVQNVSTCRERLHDN